ncbi:hypothetical protein AMJ47_02360 [Parcubacteria bacterium DG_72]|nr:MAG: hypothetical protein AMJ47_02360 [Parcubacteria bacterium DG_72]
MRFNVTFGAMGFIGGFLMSQGITSWHWICSVIGTLILGTAAGVLYLQWKKAKNLMKERR